jgi:hypothetical protein
MFSCFGFVYGLWWVLPVMMVVAMMALCFFVTGRAHRMGCCMRGKCHFCDQENKLPDSAILDQ